MNCSRLRRRHHRPADHLLRPEVHLDSGRADYVCVSLGKRVRLEQHIRLFPRHKLSIPKDLGRSSGVSVPLS